MTTDIKEGQPAALPEKDALELRIEAVAKEWTEALAAEQGLGSLQVSQDPTVRMRQEILYIKAQARTRVAGVERDKLLKHMVEVATK